MRTKEASVKIRRRTAFASIPNDLVRDTNLSPEARLLVIYVMGCSDNWTFYVSNLMKILNCRKDKWQRIRREAIDAGYLRIHTKHAPSGHLQGYIWEVFDQPQAPDEDLPDVVGNDAPIPENAENVDQNREPEKPAIGEAKNDVHREPEKPAAGEDVHREPEKTASGKNPPAGKTGSLKRKTKKKEKLLSCAGSAHHGDFDFGSFFNQLWPMFPRQGSWADTEAEALSLIDAGEAPEDLRRAVAAYAKYSAGFDAQRIKLSQNFFKDDFWRKHLPQPERKATQGEILQARADTILTGKVFLCSRISAASAGECIEAGLVTLVQCRNAGIAI
ncbi:helix-turn-helix domain-containing protein [Epibacterium ulvae]|uniref:helix-turn-helix domain-containing protein n=1 Tax=Epibacterium ulvae TaxID=1156985 RepID=UPI00248FA8FD|nr:helix-turn-helix domain-containing protein [Epibacterium ulvae]